VTADHGADVERLAARAAEFDEHAQRARNLADDLRAALDGPAPWGNDDIGRRFADQHADAAEQTVQRLTDLSAKLADMGSAFAKAARTYRATDGASADAADRIRHGLGEG
jgi:uncharacterized protein YukE